ncbi:MAG TPA: M23 family metallopeptidase [Ktedonobacteraceae bacterium]|nr:M23 family metallopeptidase [Ktedonobacteraceae bacterium]
MQGNNQGDHIAAYESEYAFDFAVIGQSNFVITAAQSGQVIGFNNSSSIRCDQLNEESYPIQKPLKKCWASANFVLIADDDGKTASLYVHLLPYSGEPAMPKVTCGEHVNQGDPIGLAGTTGFSTGIHVHFQVESLPPSTSTSNCQQTNPSSGWWWTNSIPASFSNPEVLTQDACLSTNSNGVPQTDQCFLVSANPTPTTSTFRPFVGQWFGHARELIFQLDGHATYTGRVFRFCDTNPPPCDDFNRNPVGGLNEELLFTHVVGSTAYGTIISGTDDLVFAGETVHLKVGDPLSLTLQPEDKLSVSDTWVLCGPQTPPSDPMCSGA